jgi:nucleotide-binding universal stress UspA family protein
MNAGTESDAVAVAVLQEMWRLSPTPAAVHVSDDAVVVDVSSPAEDDAVVVAAVEDDGNPGRIIRYAAAQAHKRSVPLRVVHVWTDRATSGAGVRVCRHDRMSDADRLLSAILYDHLPAESADGVEREILHDRDPVSALIALSAGASLIVVAARSGQTKGGEALGDTARGLVGHTACPLALLPVSGDREEPVSPCTW